MAYHVIKVVKGRKYLYEQASFRDGKTVRTNSRYIGAVDPRTGEVTQADSNESGFINQFRQEIRDRIVIAGAEEAEPSSKDAPEIGGSPQGLQIKIDCERFKISRYSLEEDWRKHRDRLLKLAIFPKKSPRVFIEYGRRLRVFKRFLSDVYVVTIPKYSKGNREHLRREYRRAISLASIEAVEKERPDLFARLSLQFDERFRETQTLLNKYIMATNDRDAMIKAIVLKYFCSMPPIAGGKLEPKKIGLVEYGKREKWQDEAASLMADIQRRGWYNLYAESMDEARKANSAVHFIAQDKKQWGRRKKLAMRRAEIRIRLNEEKAEKLKILKEVFGF